VAQAKADFQLATRWIFSPCTNRLHAGSTAKYRYLSIQKNFQDGSVWLMIGKPNLKRRDKVSFAREAALGGIEIQLPKADSIWKSRHVRKASRD
jgi:hypothetical protein